MTVSTRKFKGTIAHSVSGNKNEVNFFIFTTAEQGHPTVAFNPSTQEYLVAWQVSAPVIQGGAHIIVAQTVYGHTTTRKSNPYMLVNAKLPTGFRPVVEPKLMYNAGSGKWNIFQVLL